jgi:hypothetical protein
VSGGRIVVDYEELRRMAGVWSEAAKSLARQGLSVAALAVEPAIAADAVFDPGGAARAEISILAAASVPHGLASLAARLAADSLALDAVVLKEQLVDDFPARKFLALGEWLASAPTRIWAAPGATLLTGRDDAISFAEAAVGYAAPFTEPMLRLFAPSALFRADLAAHRPVRVDPVFGLPLSLIAVAAPEGPGYVAPSRYQASWGDTPPGSLAGAMRRVADLERWPEAVIAIEQVRADDGVTRYVVELPGIRSLGATADPQDLAGAVSAMAFPATAYSRCVAKALDAAGVPRGADVMLVGHSEGGMVAMDLAADPAFNGGRARVTDVVAAGSPISAKSAAHGSGTRVFSVENANDIVTHLDADDSADQAARLTYQFADETGGIGSSHAATLYADRIASLAGSPNPRFRDFESRVAPYLSGSTRTTVFAVRDAASGRS